MEMSAGNAHRKMPAGNACPIQGNQRSNRLTGQVTVSADVTSSAETVPETQVHQWPLQ